MLLNILVSSGTTIRKNPTKYGQLLGNITTIKKRQNVIKICEVAGKYIGSARKIWQVAGILIAIV